MSKSSKTVSDERVAAALNAVQRIPTEALEAGVVDSVCAALEDAADRIERVLTAAGADSGTVQTATSQYRSVLAQAGVIREEDAAARLRAIADRLDQGRVTDSASTVDADTLRQLADSLTKADKPGAPPAKPASARPVPPGGPAAAGSRTPSRLPDDLAPIVLPLTRAGGMGVPWQPGRTAPRDGRFFVALWNRDPGTATGVQWVDVLGAWYDVDGCERPRPDLWLALPPVAL